MHTLAEHIEFHSKEVKHAILQIPSTSISLLKDRQVFALSGAEKYPEGRK
jgi:hypothetical protein